MRIILLLLPALLFAACRKTNIPEGVLPKDKMQAVFWDMLQADEYLKDYVFYKDSTRNDTTESIEVYERVFKFNKTSREQFDKSFDYYRNHPALMKEIVDSLNSRYLHPSVTDEKPPIVNDSILNRTKERLRIN